MDVAQDDWARFHGFDSLQFVRTLILRREPTCSLRMICSLDVVLPISFHPAVSLGLFLALRGARTSPPRPAQLKLDMMPSKESKQSVGRSSRISTPQTGDPLMAEESSAECFQARAHGARAALLVAYHECFRYM